jgi:heat shock protein HslJ
MKRLPNLTIPNYYYPIATTRKSCTEPVMNQETTFLTRRGNALQWRAWKSTALALPSSQGPQSQLLAV